MENNIWQEEIPQNKESLKSMKKIKPMKKIPSRVIQPIETKNRYSPLETEESPTENENARTDSPNTKVMVKQNAINTATQNTKILMIKLKVIQQARRSSQLPLHLVILWLKTLKAEKCQAVLAKLTLNSLTVQKLRT